MTGLESHRRSGLPAWTACLALTVLAPAGGCSEEEDPIQALASYYSRTQQLGCQQALECCTDHELGEIFDRPISDIEICAAIPQDVSAAMQALYGDSFAAGRVRFDSGRGAACIAAYESLTCAQYAEPGGVAGRLCEDPLIPQQGPGEPCNQSYECTTGYCDGGSMMTEGACGELPGDGEECNLRCVEGYYCDIWHTCLPVMDDGETCFLGEECSSGYCFVPDGGTDRLCGVMCDGR